MYWLNNLALIRNATSTSQLGRSIRKVIFLCGEIKDLVANSDKHCTYLEDPEDIDLNNEFEDRNEDEVGDLKRECVIHVVVIVLFGWLTHDCQVGNAATQLSKNSTVSSQTFRRKLTKGCLKSSPNFMQTWVTLPYTLVYLLTELTLASARCWLCP